MDLIFFILLVPIVYYSIYLIYHTYLFVSYQPQYIENQFFVSIIIPVRNEQENIKACLDSIIEQNYPKSSMEIIVVNDHSEDETMKMIENYSSYSNIKILNLPSDKKGKKESIHLGIQNSKGDIILTTDGDTVRGKDWVQTMMNYFDEQTAMVSGPVKLTGESIWQQMQALEFSGLILLGAAMIANKRPSLCNGANLAYRRKVYEEVDGFHNIDQIASGDDELLLHKIRKLKKYNIQFVKNDKAIVETPAHQNLKTFVYQRLRWASKSTVYPDKLITFHLMMAYLANLSILISFLLSLEDDVWKWNFFVFFILKILSEWIILLNATKFLNQKKLLKWIFIEQFLHVLYVLWVGLISQFKFSYEWKGRRVK